MLLDKSEFTNENYSPYGHVEAKIRNNDLGGIVGYSYETEYFTELGMGGVMFINNFGNKVWNAVRTKYIDKLEEEENEMCTGEVNSRIQ